MNKLKIRELRRICVAIGVLLLFSGICFGTFKLFFDPHRGTVDSYALSEPLDKTLPKNAALKDLSIMLRYLEQRHPACLKGVPEAVMSQYREEAEVMPEQVTVLSLWRSAAAIMARMQDAHTGVRYIADNPVRLPVEFEIKDDNLNFTMEGIGSHRVLEIGGMPPQTLLETYLDRSSYEQERYGRYLFTKNLPYKTYLAFMGVDITGEIEIVYETQSGPQRASYAFELPDEQSGAQPDTFVSYEIDAEHSLGILRLRSCKYNDVYRSTVKDFFAGVRDNSIRNVAVDLRGNGGGNSVVANEFIRYLNVDRYYSFGGVNARFGPILIHNKRQEQVNKQYQEMVFSGNVYALTSTNTFSAALDFAAMLQDNGIGRVIGETPGGMPASYGDILRFQLPGSGLAVSISYKYFGRIDTEKSALPLIPDYETSRVDAQNRLMTLIAR